MSDPTFDPALDLVLERVVPVSPDRVWRAWTDPAQLVKWFTPAPWSTVSAELDLRPGGLFRTVMRSPEGEETTNDGCFLEVVPGRRLVFTDALLPGFRPSAEPFFTAIVELAAVEGGTRYRATARHGTRENRDRHDEMGFATGWGAALDQLVALAQQW